VSLNREVHYIIPIN